MLWPATLADVGDLEGTPLLGGRSHGVVVRMGDTVRRQRRAETETVHELLRHLEAVGFAGAPRALGFDEHGREILSFMDGEVGVRLGGQAPPDFVRSDDTLEAVGVLLRHFHDATASFVPSRTARWMRQVGHPRTGEVICHNDLGPYNTVFREGRPVAFIDFDDAAPGPREWDLAYVAYRFVPFYPDDVCILPVNGWPRPPERSHRLALLCAAYGWQDPQAVMPVMHKRISAMVATGLARHEAGVAMYGAEWKQTMLPRLQRDRDFIASSY